ncbi:trans-Golgi network integral membrane protein 1-like isoform X3 [Sparus aurata]|uniref:trans-Golgi network integral membrane protein 1-like isoform X3 n=1 Tax=Sparus aurata TaxID=8175 RepID=UPI0011C16C8A|nr:trans-Golgi network integral membrane protein 1-like isoform X3 [Sparus aurata]
MGLGIICCKKHNKACFAKGNRCDPENQKHRGETKGSDESTADERRGRIDRTPTMLSTQRLFQDLKKNKDENEETESPPSTPRSESHSPLDPSNPARNDKGDADADRLSKPAEELLLHHASSDSERENDPKPADVSVNTTSDLEWFLAPEHQDLKKDEDGKSPPANVVTPVPKPRSQFTQNSPNTAPEVTAGGQKKDANSDQVNRETDTSGVGETHESGSSAEDEQSSPVSEQKDSETKRHDQDPVTE